MTVKAQLLDTIEMIPETELPVLLEVARRFVPVDDVATSDDLSAHDAAMMDYERGETVSIDEIDWN